MRDGGNGAQWGLGVGHQQCGAQGKPHPDKLHQGVVDVGAAGQEEAAAGAELVEEEELLVLQQGGRHWGIPAAVRDPQPRAGQGRAALTLPMRR